MLVKPSGEWTWCGEINEMVSWARDSANNIGLKCASDNGNVVIFFRYDKFIEKAMEDMENTWENWLKAHNLPKTYLKSPDFRFAVQKTINYGSSIVYHVFQNFGEDEFQVDQLEEVVKSLPKRQRGNIIPM